MQPAIDQLGEARGGDSCSNVRNGMSERSAAPDSLQAVIWDELLDRGDGGVADTSRR